jgi:O-antigen/teichoic acid export membrane protein
LGSTSAPAQSAAAGGAAQGSAGFSQRVFRAGFWVMLLRVSQQVVSLVRTVIIANLLGPGDFGLLGIALLAQTWVELATSTGFSTALIQRKGDIESYLNVAWTVEIVRAGITGTALILSAGWIARFFEAPAAAPIIQVIGAVYALKGFQNIALIHLRRDLNFRVEFIFRLSVTVANSVVAVTLAFLLHSVWALAFGVLAEGVTAVVMSYVVHPYRPRLRFEFSKAWELFRYGRGVVLAEGAQLVAWKADGFFIGKMLGPVALGLYQLGTRLSLLIPSELGESVARVSFPTYAALQDELPRLRRMLNRSLEMGLVVILPSSAVIALLAPELVREVLGEQWLGGVSVVQVLAFAGIARFITMTGVMPFQGIGQPSIGMRVTFVSLISMVVLLYPLISTYGLAGAAAAMLLGNLLAIPYLLRKWNTAIGVRIRDVAKAPLAGLALAALTTGAVLLTDALLTRRDLTYLLVALSAAGLAYLAGSLLLWRRFGSGVFVFASAVRQVPR